MSTAVVSKPGPVTPTAARKKGDASEGDQRIGIRDVSWSLYERLSEAIGENQHIRLAYDGKDLEIMVAGWEHEDYKHLVTLFLEFVMTACEIEGRLAGLTTWIRPEVLRGLEADQCAYFDHEKLAVVEKARLAESKDIAHFPNPDLAVEIDISDPKIDRRDIYAKLNVAEIWRYAGGDIVIEQLMADGSYAKAEWSKWLPVRPEDIRRWLLEEDSSKMLIWKRRLAEWATGLAAGGNGTR
jgi:Uma2 family endonuclease